MLKTTWKYEALSRKEACGDLLPFGRHTFFATSAWPAYLWKVYNPRAELLDSKSYSLAGISAIDCGTAEIADVVDAKTGLPDACAVDAFKARLAFRVRHDTYSHLGPEIHDSVVENPQGEVYEIVDKPPHSVQIKLCKHPVVIEGSYG